MGKTIAIAADHAGFHSKEEVKEILQSHGTEVLDFGTDSDASVDYPDYGKAAMKAIMEGKADRGVLVCGSGVGMSIVANKFPGIRAVLAADAKTAEMSRKHNDSNVLVLVGWKLSRPEADEILTVWMNTEFEGGRHQRRLDKIDDIEKEIKNKD